MARKSTKPNPVWRFLSRAFDRTDPGTKVLQDLTWHATLFGLAVWGM